MNIYIQKRNIPKVISLQLKLLHKILKIYSPTILLSFIDDLLPLTSNPILSFENDSNVCYSHSLMSSKQSSIVFLLIESPRWLLSHIQMDSSCLNLAAAYISTSKHSMFWNILCEFFFHWKEQHQLVPKLHQCNFFGNFPQTSFHTNIFASF